MSEHQTNYFVQLTNTDFLKLLLQTDQKVRNTTYFKKSTEKLLKMKSAELGISANSLKEFCLLKYIPEMQMWN